MCNNSQGYYGDNNGELKVMYGMRGGVKSIYNYLAWLEYSQQHAKNSIPKGLYYVIMDELIGEIIWKDVSNRSKNKPYYRQNDRW